MVRNLVLIPFIDSACTHFIFSCGKYRRLFVPGNRDEELLESASRRSLFFEVRR